MEREREREREMERERESKKESGRVGLGIVGFIDVSIVSQVYCYRLFYTGACKAVDTAGTSCHPIYAG